MIKKVNKLAAVLGDIESDHLGENKESKMRVLSEED